MSESERERREREREEREREEERDLNYFLVSCSKKYIFACNYLFNDLYINSCFVFVLYCSLLMQ